MRIVDAHERERVVLGGEAGKGLHFNVDRVVRYQQQLNVQRDRLAVDGSPVSVHWSLFVLFKSARERFIYFKIYKKINQK